ncbi:MAG TPA: prephenate dehydrogenase [Gemmatimonadaceae bacterium]
MKPIARVAVVGLGLMGGSLARALAVRDVHVLGYDDDPESLDSAEREGIVHERLDAELTRVASADVIVLATPVDAAIRLLPSVARSANGVRLVMDMASTKRSIVSAAELNGLGTRYVGAHPLTGSHRSGWRASRATLFDEARVFLCPTSATTPDALALAEAFWRGLRAGVEIMNATQHDEQMAWRSHLPHVMSGALAVVLGDMGIPRSALGPGGRDMTRLAGSAPSLWTSIVEDNHEPLVVALAALERRLARVREDLRARDSAGTHEFLAGARAWFDGEPLTGGETER